MTSSFEHNKQVTLSKLDKSPKGSVDRRIISLCDTINNQEDFYTLSSCSGRVALLRRSQIGKKDTSWEYVTHDLAQVDEMWEVLTKYDGKDDLYLRQESVILHIACKNEQVALSLMHTAKSNGYNQVGIIGMKPQKVVVELICDSSLITPVHKQGKLLISRDYFGEVIQEANKNQKTSWKCIQKLGNSFKR